MDVQTAIEQRRSIKQFDPEHIMSSQEENRLIELAMLSPTAFNIQHWRFVVVRDSALREQIKQATYGQAQISDASLLIVLCADTKAWEKQPERYWRNLSEEGCKATVATIDQYYRGRDQVQRDEAMRSCGIAAQTLMLAAKGMGYDSCAIDLSDIDSVGKLINLPSDHVIGMYIAIGKASREPWPRSGPLAPHDVIVSNRFPA